MNCGGYKVGMLKRIPSYDHVFREGFSLKPRKHKGLSRYRLLRLVMATIMMTPKPTSTAMDTTMTMAMGQKDERNA